MSCLSQEQIAQRAVGLEIDDKLVSHLKECAACQANLAHLQLLTAQLTVAHENLDRGHADARTRLLASLPDVDQQSRPAPAGKTISSWFGELNMRQRFTLSGLSLVMLFGLFIVFLNSSSQPVSAMELMKKNMNKAKSYKMKMVQEMKLVRKPGQPPVTVSRIGVWYWSAPGSVRMDSKADELDLGMNQTSLHPFGKSGIQIDHKRKTYRHVSARLGHMSPIMMLEGLRKYSGEADRELGTKTIKERKASGFVIDSKKIDPDAQLGPIELWIDSETNLPVELHMEMKNSQVPVKLSFIDFQWNIKIDAKLFDLTPPEGYTNATPKPRSSKSQVRLIASALKLYAELSGGHYPRVKMVYGDVVRDEMLKMADLKGQSMAKLHASKTYQRIMKETRGVAVINEILRENDEAIYNGRTVGPKDKIKVLLRWKTGATSYHVMYGDLRSESVTKERLRTLESQ